MFQVLALLAASAAPPQFDVESTLKGLSADSSASRDEAYARIDSLPRAVSYGPVAKSASSPECAERRARSRRLLSTWHARDVGDAVAWFDASYPNADDVPCIDAAWYEPGSRTYDTSQGHWARPMTSEMMRILAQAQADSPDDVSDKFKVRGVRYAAYREATRRWAIDRLRGGMPRELVSAVIWWMRQRDEYFLANKVMPERQVERSALTGLMLVSTVAKFK